MGFSDGAREAVIGIIIGMIVTVIFMLPLEIPNAPSILGALHIITFIGLINKIETIKNIPWRTAAGYFLVIFSLGSIFMPQWEIDLHFVLLLVYIISHAL